MESYFGKIKGLQRTNLLKWDSIRVGATNFSQDTFRVLNLNTLEYPDFMLSVL